MNPEKNREIRNRNAYFFQQLIRYIGQGTMRNHVQQDAGEISAAGIKYANIHESCESITETNGSDGCPEANPAEGRERMPLDNAPLPALIIGTLNPHSKGASR